MNLLNLTKTAVKCCVLLYFSYFIVCWEAGKINKFGRSYTPGVPDGGLFQQVRFLWRTEPSLSVWQVHQRTGGAVSQIYRIQHMMFDGLVAAPAIRRWGDRQYIQKAMRRYIQAVFDSFGPTGGYVSLVEFAMRISRLVGHRVHLLEVSNVLVHQLRLRERKGIYEHPNKWKNGNLQYYCRFLLWRASYTPIVHVRFVFFDEVRVNRGNLGRVHVRGRDRGTVVHDYHRQGGESWTINFMTNLLSDPPFFFTIVPGSSNAFRYVDFWTRAVREGHLHQGQVVLVDNMNFHVKGWSANVVQKLLAIHQINYKALPKYSPEFNPAELVFSLLKRCLIGARVEDNLVSKIFECLKIVKKQHILHFYMKWGYMESPLRVTSSKVCT